MTDQERARPATARWTHIALPTRDLDLAVQWWLEWSPLEQVHRREDSDGRTAWLGHTDSPDSPFVLVLIEKFDGFDAVATTLSPLAHIGIELPSRHEVDEVAAKAAEAGILSWPATDHGAPVGYICAVTDPDGNIVEFSHDQGVYSAAREASISPLR